MVSGGERASMKPVEFKNAYYIKLGRKGQWEDSSIRDPFASFIGTIKAL
jgi:hypothetical protein